MTAPDFENRPLRSPHPFFLSAKLPVALITLTGLGFSPFSYADFALNFSGATSTTVVQGAQAIGGQTPFTTMPNSNQAGELVVDPSTGISYWHYVMGDPASGFAQEVYIQAGGTFNATTGACNQDTVCSASAGTVANQTTILSSTTGNATTGNGTGNPNDVIIRQVIGGTWNATTKTWTCDTDFCSEFVKSSFADKPKITQNINESDFSATFIMDMSAIAIGNNSTDLTLTSKGSTPTGASFTNAQTVTDPSTGQVISSFDMATDSQSTFVTGGKYTYANGRGVLGSGGNYVYVDGSYDLPNVNYIPFMDKNDPSNVWTDSSQKP